MRLSPKPCATSHARATAGVDRVMREDEQPRAGRDMQRERLDRPAVQGDQRRRSSSGQREAGGRERKGGDARA